MTNEETIQELQNKLKKAQERIEYLEEWERKDTQKIVEMNGWIWQWAEDLYNKSCKKDHKKAIHAMRAIAMDMKSIF